MTKLLIRLFIKDKDNASNPVIRAHYGMLAGGVGIFTNLLLTIFKFAIGIFTKSITIIADSANSLSDSLSSSISIFSFKYINKSSDKKHPYGHARIEYVATLIIAICLIVIGVEILISSIKKIISPSPLHTSNIVYVILIISILAKFWLFLFYKKIGSIISSQTLKANATDSIMDTASTFIVLLSYIVYNFANINVEGYFGVLIALIICYSSLVIVIDSINTLIGKQPSKKCIEDVTNKIESNPNVISFHDLIIHDYGYNRYFASVHILLDSSISFSQSAQIVEDIEDDILKDLNINIVCQAAPYIDNLPEIIEINKVVTNIINNISEDLSFHDLRIEKKNNISYIAFDLTLPDNFKIKPTELVEIINQQLQHINPYFLSNITFDNEFTSFKA